MTRLGLMLVLTVVALPLLPAETGTAETVPEETVPAEQAAKELINTFRDTMYLHEADSDELGRLYEVLLDELSALSLSARELSYRKAQAAYYLARGYQAPQTVEQVMVQDGFVRKGRFKKLQKSYDRLGEMTALYEEAMALAESYLQEGRDARGVRLYAEGLSQLSTLKTLGFLMNNGPKVRPLAEEALALNAGEVKAQMLLAARYVFSPAVWGGNPDKGIAMLESIAAVAEEDRENRHNLAVAIGYAHTMAGRWDEAARSFREALEVYPTNVYALGMLKLCEAGGPSGQ